MAGRGSPSRDRSGSHPDPLQEPGLRLWHPRGALGPGPGCSPFPLPTGVRGQRGAVPPGGGSLLPPASLGGSRGRAAAGWAQPAVQLGPAARSPAPGAAAPRWGRARSARCPAAARRGGQGGPAARCPRRDGAGGAAAPQRGPPAAVSPPGRWPAAGEGPRPVPLRCWGRGAAVGRWERGRGARLLLEGATGPSPGPSGGAGLGKR